MSLMLWQQRESKGKASCQLLLTPTSCCQRFCWSCQWLISPIREAVFFLWTLIPFSAGSLFSHFTGPASCLCSHKGAEQKWADWQREKIQSPPPQGKHPSSWGERGADACLKDDGTKRFHEKEPGSGWDGGSEALWRFRNSLRSTCWVTAFFLFI